MLSLSRRISQEIVIGDNEVSVMVVRVRGDRVWLGITAPPNIRVHRREVYEEIRLVSPEKITSIYAELARNLEAANNEIISLRAKLAALTRDTVSDRWEGENA